MGQPTVKDLQAFIYSIYSKTAFDIFPYIITLDDIRYSLY